MSFLEYDTFKIQKNGNSEEEYEDAFSIKEVSEEEIRFAIADGATESSFAGIWAQLLTEGYCESIECSELKKRWIDQINAMDLPWYGQEKASQGAYAALLGLSIFHNQTNSYEAIALGDTNLFQLREDKLIKAFPLSKSEQFSNSPNLLSSADIPQTLEQEFLVMAGKWEVNDRFFLMTDALAQWFLCGIESKKQVLKTLLEIDSQEDFTSLVKKEREREATDMLPNLKNDDVTLIRIALNL